MLPSTEGEKKDKLRVLIISDSHGRNDYVKLAIQQAGVIDGLIHLGDVEDDVEELRAFAGCPSYIVMGNNDYGSGLPEHLNIMIGGKKIFLTHGHRYGVNYDLERVGLLGTLNKMDIVMYGHTHYPYFNQGEDMILLNPGSLTYPRQEGRARTFFTMEIDGQGNVEFFWHELNHAGKRNQETGGWEEDF